MGEGEVMSVRHGNDNRSNMKMVDAKWFLN